MVKKSFLNFATIGLPYSSEVTRNQFIKFEAENNFTAIKRLKKIIVIM